MKTTKHILSLALLVLVMASCGSSQYASDAYIDDIYYTKGDEEKAMKAEIERARQIQAEREASQQQPLTPVTSVPVAQQTAQVLPEDYQEYDNAVNGNQYASIESAYMSVINNEAITEVDTLVYVHDASGYYSNGFQGTYDEYEYAERIRKFHGANARVANWDPEYGEVFQLDPELWNVYIENGYAWITPQNENYMADGYYGAGYSDPIVVNNYIYEDNTGWYDPWFYGGFWGPTYGAGYWGPYGGWGMSFGWGWNYGYAWGGYYPPYWGGGCYYPCYGWGGGGYYPNYGSSQGTWYGKRPTNSRDQGLRATAGRGGQSTSQGARGAGSALGTRTGNRGAVAGTAVGGARISQSNSSAGTRGSRSVSNRGVVTTNSRVSTTGTRNGNSVGTTSTGRAYPGSVRLTGQSGTTGRAATSSYTRSSATTSGKTNGRVSVSGPGTTGARSSTYTPSYKRPKTYNQPSYNSGSSRSAYTAPSRGTSTTASPRSSSTPTYRSGSSRNSQGYRSSGSSSSSRSVSTPRSSSSRSVSTPSNSSSRSNYGSSGSRSTGSSSYSGGSRSSGSSGGGRSSGSSRSSGGRR